MRRFAMVVSVFSCVLLCAAQSSRTEGEKGREATVYKIKIVQEHPRNHNAKVGDVLQFYVRFAVVPAQMIEPKDVKAKVKPKEGDHFKSVQLVRVVSTQNPRLVGAGEVSAFFYAQTHGTSYVTFEPIPGHSKEPIKVAVLVANGEEKK